MRCGTDHLINLTDWTTKMTITKNAGKALVMTALVALFSGATSSTFAAETKWEKDHPRREQVNHRLANQDKRIQAEVKEGGLTKTKAAALHKDDRKIRQEERAMASQNGGHITKLEQKTLNRQENAVSKKIGT